MKHWTWNARWWSRRQVAGWLGGMLMTTGCSGLAWTARDGTAHHLIIGFGVVSVNQSNATAAVVASSHAIGLVASDQPGVRCAIGFSTQTATLVPAGARDVRIETSQRLFGPLVIQVDAAKLSNMEVEDESW